MQYHDLEYLLVTTQLVFVMAGMGATLTVRDFLEVTKRTTSMLAGFVGQFLLAPAIALAISRAARLPPGISVGLVLVSVVPGGSLSNLFTYLGKGNVALSVSMTISATLGSIVFVPVLLQWFVAADLPSEFSMPVGSILRDVGLFLLAPLSAGMLLGRFFPLRKRRFARWSVRLGMLTLFALVLCSLTSGRIRPGQYGLGVPLAIIAYCLASQQATMLPFRLFKLPTPDRLAVGIEVTVRNVNLGLLFKAILFPAGETADPVGEGVLFALLFYGAVSLFTAIPTVLIHRRIAARRVLLATT